MSRRIEVKAHPKAKLEKVEPDGSGGFKVWTTAPADRGAANAAVAKLLAKHLGVPPGRVTLVRGGTSRNKLFEVED